MIPAIAPHEPNKAQNGNQGTIQAYSLFDLVPITGFIGGFLITFFQLLVYGLGIGNTRF